MAGIRLFLLHSYRCYMDACHAVCMLLMFVRGGSGGMDVLTQEGQGAGVTWLQGGGRSVHPEQMKLGCHAGAAVCWISKLGVERIALFLLLLCSWLAAEFVPLCTKSRDQ